MENSSINRYKIDWANFRKDVFAVVSPTAQSIRDTYAGIGKALALLGDNHSFYTSPSGYTISGNLSIVAQFENIGTPVIPSDIGYVLISPFSGASVDAEIAFAKQIQDKIMQQDHPDLKGWIVDLRNNTGGNMWPMLAGIGPILGDGIAGYFVSADGSAVSWAFQNGASVYGGSTQVTKLDDSYNLLVSNPKVAVLLNGAVASSGEAIAVSFIGRGNTKSFGSATLGLSTGNAGFVLSDNAVLNLTTSYFADRSRNLYGGIIEPDMASSLATIIDDAIAWIRE